MIFIFKNGKTYVKEEIKMLTESRDQEQKNAVNSLLMTKT